MFNARGQGQGQGRGPGQGRQVYEVPRNVEPGDPGQGLLVHTPESAVLFSSVSPVWHDLIELNVAFDRQMKGTGKGKATGSARHGKAKAGTTQVPRDSDWTWRSPSWQDMVGTRLDHRVLKGNPLKPVKGRTGFKDQGRRPGGEGMNE